MKPDITPEMHIEELVDNYSFSVRYLMQRGIRCIMCGEPIWGTLEEAAHEKGFTDEQIASFVNEMKVMANIEAEEQESDKLKFNMKT